MNNKFDVKIERSDAGVLFRNKDFVLKITDNNWETFWLLEMTIDEAKQIRDILNEEIEFERKLKK